MLCTGRERAVNRLNKTEEQRLSGGSEQTTTSQYKSHFVTQARNTVHHSAGRTVQRLIGWWSYSPYLVVPVYRSVMYTRYRVVKWQAVQEEQCAGRTGRSLYRPHWFLSVAVLFNVH